MPDLAQELVERVKEACAQARILNICGLNSKKFIGRQAVGNTLDVAAHSGILDYQPSELVITARAGTPVSQIELELNKNGQTLPFEPPFMSSASIGGTLACNLSGPARPWQASVRDAVLGIRLINGMGEQLRFGGTVIKNVAGYDLSRLQAGALGTLGVITEVSLKVIPRHDESVTLVRTSNAQEAILEMNRLSGLPIPITGACWFDEQLYIRLQGAKSAVRSAQSSLSGEEMDSGENFWNSLRDQRSVFFEGDAPLWRFSVRSSVKMPNCDGRWLIDWGGAQRWLRGEIQDRAGMEQWARDAGGQLSLFRGGNRADEVFQTLPAKKQELLKALKKAFDPAGILNPGRLYSWL